MSAKHMTERQIEILKTLRDRATRLDQPLFDQALSGTLPNYAIEALCELINNEYLTKGIRENYDPTEYGRELEALLDAVNRPRVSRP